jgi:hypothetical protein
MTSALVALRRLRDDRIPAIGLALLVLVTATAAVPPRGSSSGSGTTPSTA